MKHAALVAAGCAAVLLAGCSGGSDGPASSASATASPTSQAPAPSGSASGAAGATPSASGSLQTGVQYADPDGSYRIVTGPEWVPVAATGQAKTDHTEGWQLGEADHGFAPYVSISAAPSQGQNLATLMQSSAAGVSKGKDTLLGAELVPGVSTGSGSSPQLGRLEFTTTGPTGGPAKLHFLILISIEGATAVSAALVVPDDEYEAYRKTNEQYLRTLTAT